MNILGFDPSLVSSGFSYVDSDGEVHTGRIRTKKLRGMPRIAFIRDSFKDLLVQAGTPELIAYEGYAMGVKGGRSFDMGEGGGVIKLFAYEAGIDVLLIPPSNLKQFTTGKGVADKPTMAAAIRRVYGYSIEQNDEADAFALMKMGEAYISRRSARSHSTICREALAKCSILPGILR
jgi:Holliday junction resolvasome RuvABC endonuclease subunit